MKTAIAVDLGATSGRVVVGNLHKDQLSQHEIYRFKNIPTTINGVLNWDFSRIIKEILIGLQIANKKYEIASVGIDSWAVDYGYLNKTNELVTNPISYRDTRTIDLIEKKFTKEDLNYFYKRTGIQHLYFNTIFQILHDHEYIDLSQYSQFLLIPDLINNYLCNSISSEATNSSTTQILNWKTHNWDNDIIDRFGLPKNIFPKLHQPGKKLGFIENIDSLEGIQVLAVASHDTASAVVGTPLTNSSQSAYISSGTWSLVGIELEEPIINEITFTKNFTNEYGVGNKIRFLKNLPGMWLIEESLKFWREVGINADLKTLLNDAKKLPPSGHFFDVKSGILAIPGHIPIKINNLLRATSQSELESPAEMVRCILENLAGEYMRVILELEELAQIEIKDIFIVGGGSNNELLNQLTANYTKKIVKSGSSEATSLGNLAVQLTSKEEVIDIDKIRHIIRNSTQTKTYFPQI